MAYCAYCGREAIALCDWKVAVHKSGTCDRPVCAKHAKGVGRGKVLCVDHQRSYNDWKRKISSPAQGDLFHQEAA